MKMTSSQIANGIFYVGWIAVTAGLANTWRGWAISAGILGMLWAILIEADRRKGGKSEPPSRS